MTSLTAPPVPGVVTADAIGEKRPGINRMGVGRTVAIKPLRVEQVSKPDRQAPGGVKVVRRVHADVIVLDGGPINYGGNLITRAADDMQQPVPCVISQLWIDEVVVGNQIERYAGSGSYVVGKIKQLPPRTASDQPAWAIEDCTPEDNALFLNWWNATGGGMNFRNPAPIDLRTAGGLPGGVVAAAAQPLPAATTAPALPMPAGWDAANWLALPDQHKQQVAAAVASGRAVPQEALGYPPAAPAAPALPPLDLSGIGIAAAPAAPQAAPSAAPGFDLAAFMAQRTAQTAPAPAVIDVPPASSGIDAATWATLDAGTKAEIRTACGEGATNPPGFQ